MTVRKRAATRQDVAAEAGVSPATVSLVLTGKAEQARLSETTRHRVIEAARRLRYSPNAAARALVERRHRTIGIVLSSVQGQLHLPIIEELVISAIERAGQHGYWTIVLPPVQDELQSANAIPVTNDGLFVLRSIPVDGVIAIGDPAVHWVGRVLADPGMPIICVSDPDMIVDDKHAAMITADDMHGGHLVGQHLRERGHRAIGLIVGAGHGPPRWSSRFAGFLEETRDECAIAYTVTADWSAEAGYQAMRDLLAQNRHITAVFAASDLIAVGAMRALHELKLSIPDDMAIVGWGDMRLSAYLEPPLTTVSGPIQGLIMHAIDTLIGWLHGEDIAGSRTSLPTELIPRAST